MATDKLFVIGSSVMSFEPPDTCFVTYVGDLDADVVSRMNAALTEVAGGRDPLYLLVDLSHAGRVSEFGRRYGAGGMLALNPRATAVFGADFHLRVVVTMIMRATRLLRFDLNGPVHFFKRENEARTWLDEMRGARLGRSA
jgi:hypothetical protein